MRSDEASGEGACGEGKADEDGTGVGDDADGRSGPLAEDGKGDCGGAKGGEIEEGMGGEGGGWTWSGLR
jgi:hypothetical protein